MHGAMKIAEKLLCCAASHKKVLIPPTAVGGSFKCFLPENYPAAVEIPPTAVGGSFKSFSKRGFEISTNCRWWDYQTVQGYVCRKGLEPIHPLPWVGFRAFCASRAACTSWRHCLRERRFGHLPFFSEKTI